MNSLTAMYLWFSTVVTGPTPDPTTQLSPPDLMTIVNDDDTGDPGEGDELGPKPINNGY